MPVCKHMTDLADGEQGETESRTAHPTQSSVLLKLDKDQEPACLIVFSHASRTSLAIGCSNGDIVLSNIRGDIEGLLRGHRKNVGALAWSAASSNRTSLLASASLDGTLRVWDVERKCCVAVDESHSTWVDSIVPGFVAGEFISGGFDSTARLWRPGIEMKASRLMIEVNDGVHCVCAHRESGTYFLGLYNGDIIECRGSRRCRTFTGHTQFVTDLCISDDKMLLASAANDGVVRLWSTTTGRCQRELKGHRSGVLCLSMLNRRIWSGSTDGTVRQWCIDSGECSAVYGVGFSLGSIVQVVIWRGRMLTASTDGTIRCWQSKPPSLSMSKNMDICSFCSDPLACAVAGRCVDACARCPQCSLRLNDDDDEMIRHQTQFCPKRETRCRNWSYGCKVLLPFDALAEHDNACVKRQEHCRYTGCNVICSHDVREQHEAECDEKPEHCTNAGCEMQLKRSSMATHQLQCDWSILQCDACGADVARGQMQQHCESECEESLVQCTFCGKGKLQRCSLDLHQQECGLKSNSTMPTGNIERELTPEKQVARVGGGFYVKNLENEIGKWKQRRLARKLA